MSIHRITRFTVATSLVATFLVTIAPPLPASAAITAPAKVWDASTPQIIRESSPLAENLSGQADIVVGSHDGKVWAFNAATGQVTPNWPQSTGAAIDSSPSSADTNGDGKPEIYIGSGVAESRQGATVSFEANGARRWAFEPRDNDFPDLSMFSSPALGEVNGDGLTDVSAFSLGLLGWSLRAGDGAVNGGWPFYQDDTAFSSPALADIDGNGLSDYVVGIDSTAGGPVDHRGGMVRALRGDGSSIWEFRVDEMVRSSPAVGDIDGDGQPEIVFGTGDYWKNNGGANDSTKLFALNRNGSLKWVKDLGAYTPASPALADVDGNGRLDVAIGTWNGPNPGRVFVFDGSGNPLANWNGKASGGGVVIGQISTGDFDGDGGQDLLVPTGAGVWAYSGKTGEQLFTLNVGRGLGYQNAPLVKDVDNDGRLDIVIAGFHNGSGTGWVTRFEFDGASPAALGANGWHQFRKDNRLTGSWLPTALRTDLCAAGPTEGYWMAARDGGIFAFCDAPFHGSMGGKPLAAPIVRMAAHPDKNGYWEVASDGGVFSFGSARFHGSMGGKTLNQPIVAMAPTSDGGGYWQVASDGGIFAFGNARFYGSMGGQPLNKPIVGITPTKTGNGYWLVASDGGIFAFGDARFLGSMGGKALNRPIVDIERTDSGNGYWMVASDGGIFAFGDAQFHGSTGSIQLNQPIVGMARNESGNGYRLVASDGGLFAYNSSFLGSTGGMKINGAIVAIATA